MSWLPIAMVVQYLWNHRLLYTLARPVEWRTIDGGAKKYVDRVLQDVPPIKIKSIATDHSGRMKLRLVDSQNGSENTHHFMKVILAAHAVDALKILGTEARPDEQQHSRPRKRAP